MADTEAERLEVVDKYGLNTDEITDLIGDEDLRAITDEGREAFGVTDCWWHHRQNPADVAYAAAVDAPSCRAGRTLVAQHRQRVQTRGEKGDVLQSNGSIAENAAEHMANLSLPEYQALGGCDASARTVLPRAGHGRPDGKIPNEQLVAQEYNPHGEKGTTWRRANSGATLM